MMYVLFCRILFVFIVGNVSSLDSVIIIRVQTAKIWLLAIDVALSVSVSVVH